MTTTNLSPCQFTPDKTAVITVDDIFQLKLPEGETSESLRSKCKIVDHWRDSVIAELIAVVADATEHTGLNSGTRCINLGGRVSVDVSTYIDKELLTEEGNHPFSVQVFHSTASGPCQRAAGERIVSMFKATYAAGLTKPIDKISNEEDGGS